MDPSKRVCLKNIPQDCTKRDIAEFVRNRTGAQPHSIDLGLDADGHVRRYAHFSVEGAKNVIPALSGATWRDVTVTALPARPHYTFRLAEARRQRERAEAEEREAVEAFWAQHTARWAARTGGELSKGKAPRPFYVTRQRYATIAAEIAQRMREEHKRRNPTHRERGGAVARHQQQRKEVNTHTPEQDQQQQKQKQQMHHREKATLKGKPQRKHVRGGPSISSSVGEKKSKVETPTPPKQQEQPTKEERKLSGLQAKLAALRAKMK